MECKNLSIDARRARGFTLVAVMVASAVGVILIAIITSLVFFSARSYVAMSNYTDMGQRSQLALDKMSKEIRQARQLIAYTTNSITLKNFDGTGLAFTYDSQLRTLTRIADGKSTVYLGECDSLYFNVFQHTMKSNTFDCYDPAYLTDARVVQVMWHCSRPILGKKATTENVQSAKIVLRNH